MTSQQWLQRRRQWLAEWTDHFACRPVCMVCDTAWTLDHGDLHHRNYDRLGHERWTDLIPVCRACHDHIHTLWDATPAWRRIGRSQATVGIISRLRRRHSHA